MDVALIWRGCGEDVAWCGMVWFGVAWHGVVCCGMVWFDVAWCGTVWFGVAWCLAWVEKEEMQEIHQRSSPESGVMAADGWGQTSIISHPPFSSNFSSQLFFLIYSSLPIFPVNSFT